MSGFKLNLQDMKFVLAQIKIAEANAAGTPIGEIWVDPQGNVVAPNFPGATLAVPTPISPYGLRTVDGSYNNITPGREFWGAADQIMPRALTASFRDDADGDTFSPGGPPITNTNYNGTGNVVDADPRIISNLIVDMTLTNPAAVQSWLDNPLAQARWVSQHGEDAVQLFPGDDPATPNGVFVTNDDIAYNPNIAPDDGISAGFNAWMTFFGQFFDHGLDLIGKGGNAGKVYIPIQADDPLMAGDDGILVDDPTTAINEAADNLPPHLQFMVLTRSTIAPGGGHEATNTTTPFVDQNQTYTSHASHQVFLREYTLEGGKPHATGHLLDGSNGGLPTWADIKTQALMLGVQLTDGDALNIPLIRTDAYGKFIPHPTTGLAQVVIGLGADLIPNTADDIIASTAGGPVNTFTAGALRIGHAFLDDIADEAIPVFVGGVLQQDTDTITGNAQQRNNQGQKLTYDNELLDRHFITGDGRGNENIGLTTVHHVFHSEHNRQVEQQKLTALQGADVNFLNQWLDTDITQAQLTAALAIANLQPQPLLALTAFANTLNWDGERLFQAGRYATEMQYQHLVFEEFARKIQPNIDPFVFNSSPDINPAIFAEFAHTVYRFGHSMLTDNMPRIDADGNVFDADIDLVEAFTNPVSYDHKNDGNAGNDLTADEAAASVVRGMTIETGNAIDEFIVDSLRNNLLGLPLDLAALNIARGREAGVPSLNDTRSQLYAATSSSFLKPYESWVDFAANLKNTLSVVNFIAAYGKHDSIPEDGTLVQKRNAAMLLVLGDHDVDGDGDIDLAPLDRVAFLTSTGPRWNAQSSGLNDIDLWIGGLAEKILPFGGMLGSTFNAIFEAQLENLQDGDRFYYLTRNQGQNLLVSLEQNSFIKMIMANTSLAGVGADGIRGTEDDVIERHVGVDSFGKYDYVLEVNEENQVDYTAATPAELSAANAAVAAAQADADAATAASDAADVAAEDAAAQADLTDASALQAAALAAQATADTTSVPALLANLLAVALTVPIDTVALLAAVAAYTGAVGDDALAAAAVAAATAATADDAAALETATAAVTAAAAELAAQAALTDAEEALALIVAEGSAPGKDPLSDNPILALLGVGKVTRDDVNTIGPDANYLRFYGGEHVVVGGTNGNDTIITDDGDDGIWGDDGDDRIESGAGVDLVNGGGGNDIITDSGDSFDFLKGDEGDDVIANSNGIDIIMGGTGQDVIFVGVDDTEVFAGQGNDFILGGDGVDLIMGNEGDDWIEGGAGFDTTVGDNSELNFDSKIIGHDVMFAGSEENDHDGESGDDIMVDGESVIRSEGMMGFDWVIHKGVLTPANVDMGIPIFTTEQADILRDRYDKVEAASGWKFNDTLIGDDRVYDPAANVAGALIGGGEGRFFRDELDLAGRARIAGLDQVITNNLMFSGIYGSDWSDTTQTIFSGGNVLLGGGGSDVIAGKGGNDIIDGDRWLNVRIRLTLPGAENTAANQISTVDSLKHVFTAQDAGAPSWIGKSLFELMIDRVIVPNQLHIVREVLNGNVIGDIDTAVFWDVRANYTVTRANDGTITVRHDVVGAVVPVAPNTTFLRISDDTDTLRNIEILRFGDGAGGFEDISVGQLFPSPATGNAIINDVTPTEGQTLTVDTSTIADLNGLGTFRYQWQRSANGTTWTNVGNLTTSASFVVPDGNGTNLSNVADQFLRVRVVFTDQRGDNEVIDSVATGRVGANYDASAVTNNNGVNFTGTRGDNVIVGSNFNDTLGGAQGDDVITGGRGNDTLTGGAGNDVAVFTGPVINYALSAASTTFSVADVSGITGTDSVFNFETLRIGGSDYTVMFGTGNADGALNGGNGQQVIFGLQAADTLNGGDGNDLLVGGAGNDTVNGGNGDDFIFQGSTDGRDIIDGGAGSDTYILSGVAGAETFRIYTKAAADAAGITGTATTTEIVITRTSGATTTVIAQLDNVEEIKINTLLTTVNAAVGNGVVDSGAAGAGASGGAGDTVQVFGDFTQTSLNYNTITIEGSDGNDTIDISGLTSAHRIVFDGNGGSDTFNGARAQDVVNGIPGVSASTLNTSDVVSDYELMQLTQETSQAAAQTLLTDLSESLVFGSIDHLSAVALRLDGVDGSNIPAHAQLI